MSIVNVLIRSSNHIAGGGNSIHFICTDHLGVLHYPPPRIFPEGTNETEMKNIVSDWVEGYLAEQEFEDLIKE